MNRVVISLFHRAVLCRAAVVVVVLLFLAACGKPIRQAEVPADNTGQELILCTSPRLQVCTRQYDPVCARLQNGTWKTVANACVACSDQQVSGYLLGPCEE